MSLFKSSSFISALFGKMRAQKMKTVFHPHRKKEKKIPFYYSHGGDFPLFSEPQIISLSLQKATPQLGFRTKGQGQVGWREGAAEDRWKERRYGEGRMDGGRGHGKRRASRGEKRQTESKLQRVVSVKGTTMCLRAPEANNEESTGQNNRSTLPFRPSVNSNLNIHPPSLCADTPPPFDICFTL